MDNAIFSIKKLHDYQGSSATQEKIKALGPS